MTGKGGIRAGTAGATWIVWVSLAALIVVPLLFYAGMILGGREPAAPDSIAVRPLAVWAREATRTLGSTPLWIPYLFSGMPSYGSYVFTPASALSPLDWILRPFADARGMRYFLFLLLGGFSGFAFFRRQGVSAPAAAAASLGFVMSSYIPGVIEAGHSTKLRALMHVPLVLLALDMILDRPRPLTAAFLALAAAMLGWSNHPQILYYAMIVSILYAGGRVIAERGEWEPARLVRAAGWLVASGAIAFLLIAEPSLAVREYAPYSIRGASAGGGATWEYATAWSFSPREIVSFLFPEVFGLKGATYFGPLPFTQSTHYFGIIALLLGFLGFAARRNARSWIWLTISVVILLVGFGKSFPILYAPLYKLLPYFNKFRVPSMIYSLLPLSFGYLVAQGCDTIAQVDDGSRRPSRGRDVSSRRWLIAAGICLGVALIALIIGVSGKGAALNGGGLMKADEAGRYAADQLRALRSARWDMRIVSIVRGMILVGIALAAVPFLRRVRRPAGAAFLGLILVVDLSLVGAKFLDYVDPKTMDVDLQPTPEIDYLKGQPGMFRVLPLEDLGSNRYAAFGIASVGGYQPAKLKIYQDLLDKQLLMTPPVLSMLNVKYLLSNQDPNHPAFTRVAPGVFEFQGVRPRAWFVPSWRALPDEGGVLRSMGSQGFDPASVALFATGHAPSLPSSGLPIREVTVESDDPRGVRLRVGDGSGPGLLVISDIYYPPGWRAAIDGKATPILQADHVLQALEVPAGPHAIEVRVGSQAYRTGRALNRVGGIVLLLLAGVPLVAARQRREAASR